MNWPHLYLCIDFGFFELRTALMYRHVERNTFSYTAFHGRLFRWRFEFDIYETRRRWLDRERIPKTNYIKEAFPFLWHRRIK